MEAAKPKGLNSRGVELLSPGQGCQVCERDFRGPEDWMERAMKGRGGAGRGFAIFIFQPLFVSFQRQWGKLGSIPECPRVGLQAEGWMSICRPLRPKRLTMERVFLHFGH